MLVDSDILASVDLLGKHINDLQSNVVLGTDTIYGALNYITGYTGFSGKTDEQSGYYLVLHCVATDEDAAIKVKLINGINGEVTLGKDGIIIIQIRDKSTQKVQITVSGDGYDDIVKTYSLTGLVLA